MTLKSRRFFRSAAFFILFLGLCGNTSHAYAGSTGFSFHKQVDDFPAERFKCTAGSENFEVLNMKSGSFVRLLDGVCLDGFCETYLVRKEVGCSSGFMTKGKFYWSRRPGLFPSKPTPAEDHKRVFIRFQSLDGASGLMLDGTKILFF